LDAFAKRDIGAYMAWLRRRDILKVQGLGPKRRSALWLEYQRERNGFTHYLGDGCRQQGNPGHVQELLDYLAGRLSRREFTELFTRLSRVRCQHSYATACSFKPST
jgi:hypothetical protein